MRDVLNLAARGIAALIAAALAAGPAAADNLENKADLSCYEQIKRCAKEHPSCHLLMKIGIAASTGYLTKERREEFLAELRKLEEGAKLVPLVPGEGLGVRRYVDWCAWWRGELEDLRRGYKAEVEERRAGVDAEEVVAYRRAVRSGETPPLGSQPKKRKRAPAKAPKKAASAGH